MLNAISDHGQDNPSMLHTHFNISEFALGVLVSTSSDDQTGMQT